MPEYLSHDDYVESVRREVVETAEAMLYGRRSFLSGSRRLAALRHEVGVDGSDADFLTFVIIESETDSLPIGEIRQYWGADALTKLEPEISDAEIWAASEGTAACRSLIKRFAGQEAS